MKFFKPLHNNLADKYLTGSAKSEIVKYARGKVLDIGCGNKPYYEYIKKNIDLYFGIDYPADHMINHNIDIIASADRLPIKSKSFDLVIITQVIEHLQNPLDALCEINRILKDKSYIFISWPFIYPVHEDPRDFYRFTSHGLSYLAQQAGLSIEYINPTTGFWITSFFLLSRHIYSKTKTIYQIIWPILLTIKFICLVLNKIDRKYKYKSTLSYNALLRKIEGKK